MRTIRINNDSIVITAAIMTQLRPEIWLSDDIVNFCFMLMSIKEASTGKKRKTHFVTSSLYAQLFDDGGIYDFKKVESWSTKERLGYSMLDCDRIIVVLNQRKSHWTIMEIDIKNERLTIYDSLCSNPKDVFTQLMKRQFDNIEAWVRDCAITESIEADRVDEEYVLHTFQRQRFHRRVAEVVQQNNSSDCGVFAIMFAWCLVAGIDPHRHPNVLGNVGENYPTENHINADRFRKMIAQDILNFGTEPNLDEVESAQYTQEQIEDFRSSVGVINILDSSHHNPNKRMRNGRSAMMMTADLELAAAKKKTDADDIMAKQLANIIPDVRSKKTDAMIDMFLSKLDGIDVPSHQVPFACSWEMRADPRRVYFTERTKGPRPTLRRIALAVYIKKTYEASSGSSCFDKVAADALELFSLVSLINDFMPNVVLSGLSSDKAYPPWATMLLRRLPPIAAPFEARDAGDMRRALLHFRCPRTTIFELFDSARIEANVEDSDIIHITGYESSITVDSESDDDEAEVKPELEKMSKLNPEPEPDLAPDPEPDPEIQVEGMPEPEPVLELELEHEPDLKSDLELEPEPELEVGVDETKHERKNEADMIYDTVANIMTEIVADVVSDPVDKPGFGDGGSISARDWIIKQKAKEDSEADEWLYDI